MITSLGIDIGSSSVKLSLLDIETGSCVASCTLPQQEMPIEALHSGWAEQDPDMWWDYIEQGLRQLNRTSALSQVRAIGITYQMHGLVCIDRQGVPLRKAIIWCDSRAVPIGARAFQALGPDYCLEHLLNSPGNFTASKMAWVKENEPDILAKTHTFFLPGDYIVYRLTGTVSTTAGGLSEQILWDFKEAGLATSLLDYYGLDHALVPECKPAFGVQCRTSVAIEQAFGIPQGTPIAYRAGDQPNNAFSLNVMDAGEIAATAGTSGVVYGVTDSPKADALSRVNPFLHVNHTDASPRLGVLLCINGTGILNAWMRKQVAPDLSYVQMNECAQQAPVGSDGLVVLPFGNGAERMLQNRFTGSCVVGLDLNRHSRAHLLRAAQEGIAFSFRYGLDIMRQMGIQPSVIRAGEANMFLSPLFRSTLATLCNVSIELYNTDGALGAARGGAWGAGLYESREACFSALKLIRRQSPVNEWQASLEDAYLRWKDALDNLLNNK